MLSARTTALVALVALSLFASCAAAKGDVIYTQDFNSLHVGTDQQYQTGLYLGHPWNGDQNITGWTLSWAHAVEITSGDKALMLWDGTSATLNSGIAANTLGTTYKVEFDAGPGVYSAESQATKADDKFVVELLNASNDVVASKTVSPGAWAGSETLTSYSFTYDGDGTGDVRIHIRTLASQAQDFVGTVDNLSVSSIPEPATGAITMSAALVALLAYAWRKRK